MSSQADDKRQAAREVIDILHEISALLVRDCCLSRYDRKELTRYSIDT